MNPSANRLHLPRAAVAGKPRATYDLPLLAILFGLLLLGGLLITRLGIAGFEMFVRDADMSADPEPVAVRIAEAVLTVPQNMIRFGSERGGRLKKLDLHVHWPSLAGFTVERAAEFQAAPATTTVIYLTIRPASGPMSPQERFSRVYPRVLADDVRRTAEGYVVRSFRPGHGYDGEELYIARDPVRPLVARCDVAADGGSATCIAEFRAEPGLEISYRFPRMLLGDWREIDAGLRLLIAELAVPAP